MQFSNHMTTFLQNFFYILDLFFKHSSSAQMFNLVLWSFRRDDDRIANADLGKIGTPLCTIMTHESRNSGLPRIFTFRNRFVGFYNSQLGLIVNSIRFEIDSAPSTIREAFKKKVWNFPYFSGVVGFEKVIFHKK